MADHIQFEKKSDREILILVAQSVNNISDRLDTGDRKFDDHEHRLTQMETRCKTIHSGTDGKFSKARVYLLPPGLAAVVIGTYELIKEMVGK